MKDPKTGDNLKKVGENIYQNEVSGVVYVHTEKGKLEEKEFNSTLENVYSTYPDNDTYLVVDGQVLEDPGCKGPLNKVIGKNVYVGPYSHSSFIMNNDEMLRLREPISGSDLTVTDDGKFYSETLGRYFTLEQNEKGSYFSLYSNDKNLRDPKNGDELKEIGENVYQNEYSGVVYVYTEKGELEDQKFNSKLESVYSTYLNIGTYLVVDGQVLEDPGCGGPLNKVVGKNLYVGSYSHSGFIMNNDEMLRLREPISGSDLTVTDDGRYFSEALGKYFTLEQVENGSFKFMPTYLPYSNMTDVPAKYENGVLKGENGISFPAVNGEIELPMDDDLTTQEEIDESIEKKRTITRDVLDSMEKKLKGDLDAHREARQEKIDYMEAHIKAIQIATDIECANIIRTAILDSAKKYNRYINPEDLPQIPEIPEDIPKDIMDKALADARKMSEQNEKSLNLRQFGETLKVGNVVEAAEKSVTSDELKNAVSLLAEQDRSKDVNTRDDE